MAQVDLELVEDAQELGPGDGGDVVGVLHDRLVFGPQVLVEEGHEFLHADVRCLCHALSVPGGRALYTDVSESGVSSLPCTGPSTGHPV